MPRTRVLLSAVMLVSTLAISACSLSLPVGNDGSIAMIPFWDEEQGIQGVRPLDDWSKEATVVQSAIALSLADATDILLDEASLDALPESNGRYRGKALTYDLFSFESHVADIPLDIVHVDLAVAERGSATYVVALVAIPESYEANRALYEAVYTHALYALEPME